MERMVSVSEPPAYAQGHMACVKPVNMPEPPSMETPMCGKPAAFVGVRNGDGWVSGTTWCAEHVQQDEDRRARGRDYGMWPFTWQPIEG